MAQLKVGVDTSSVKKSLMDLGNYAKRSLGKSPLPLFDKATTRVLSGEATKVMERLERQTDRLRGRAKEYAKELKDAAGNAERELKAREKLLAVTQRISKIETERNRLGTLKDSIAGGGFGKGLAQSASQIPGLGSLLGAIKTPIGMGLLAGTAGIAAGAYGVSRLATGYGRYSAGLDSRIQLMGKGARDTDITSSLRGGFAKVGMDEEAVRQARLGSLSAFGAAGSSQEAVLRRAQFSRNYGVSLNALQGMGASFRAQTGTKGADRDLFKLMASAQASALEDSQIGSYLETAASMLTDIRQNGLIKSGELMGLMARLTKLTGDSPERIAQQIRGFQSAVQGSTGETNAFIQAAFATKGIGGGTIGGTQAAIQAGGIFDTNLDDYKGLSASDRNMLRRQRIVGASTQERIGAILGRAQELFPGDDDFSKMHKARFMQGILGASNPIESLDMIGKFQKAQGSPDAMAKFEKELRDKRSTPEERMLSNLTAINESQAGAVQELQIIRRIQEEAMGKQVAPAAMAMSKSLLHIDELISGIYNGLSGILPGMQSEGQKLEAAISGKTPLSPAQVAEIRGRGKSEALSVGTQLTARSIDVEQELRDARKRRTEVAQSGRGERLGLYDTRIKTLEDTLRNLNSNFDRLIGVQKEAVGIAKEHVEVSKKGTRRDFLGTNVAPERVELPSR